MCSPNRVIALGVVASLALLAVACSNEEPPPVAGIVMASVPTAGRATGIAEGGGFLWASIPVGGGIGRFDLQTGADAGVVDPIPKRSPTMPEGYYGGTVNAITVGNGTLFAAIEFNVAVRGLSAGLPPRFGAISCTDARSLKTSEICIRLDGAPTHLVYDLGSLWVAVERGVGRGTESALVRIDVKTRRVQRRWIVDGPVAALTSGGGKVWVLHAGKATSIDRSSNKKDEFELRSMVGGLTVKDDLWVIRVTAGTSQLVELDHTTGRSKTLVTIDTASLDPNPHTWLTRVGRNVVIPVRDALIVLDADTQTVKRRMKVATSTWAVATPDGTSVWLLTDRSLQRVAIP
jgi:hypothetical protein